MSLEPDASLTVESALRLGGVHLADIAEQPRLEAQVLLAEALEVSRTWLLAHPEAAVERKAAAKFIEDLYRRRTGYPLPYVLGWWEFYGRRFRVTPEVLIPRPETETLVERAVDWLRGGSSPSQVLEVGTGSGCIAVTLAIEAPACRVVASDLSSQALRVARSNAMTHAVATRVQLVQADLALGLAGPFDLVCGNLPYLPTGELPHWEVSRWEPHTALDGGPDGLDAVRRLLPSLPRLLSPHGIALLEIGDHQIRLVCTAIAQALPDWDAEEILDLAGVPRVIELRRDKRG